MISLVAQTLSETPLAERLLVAIVGPLVSAVVGTGVIGFILWKASQRADANRAAVEEARARHDIEGALRHDLLTSALSATTSLYLATQHFWRVKTDAQIGGSDEAAARRQLDEQYMQSREQTKIIEIRLEAMFQSPIPALRWHTVDDLLTVRYMQLIGRDTERLYRINAKDYKGKSHTGLEVAEMKDPRLLLNAYHDATREAVTAIMEHGFRAPPRST